MATGHFRLQQVRYELVKSFLAEESVFSAITTAMHPYGSSHCIAYESGLVLWVPPVQFTTYCEMNLKYWPLDSQECTIQFGSWTYNGNQINLTLNTNRTDAKVRENEQFCLCEFKKFKNWYYSFL